MPFEVLIPLNALPAACMRWLSINAPELVGKDCEWLWSVERGGLVVREFVPPADAAERVVTVATETRLGAAP